MSQRPRIPVPVPLVLLVAAVAACGSGHAPASAPAPPARVVEAARAERADRPLVVEVVGTVRAARAATIAPLVAGTVVELRVAPGSVVRAGDVVARLSARELDARLEQASAVRAQAELERRRAAALRAQDAISAAQLDAAQSELAVAEARRAEAGTQIARTVLRAPFAGVITAKLVEVGDTVMPGQPVLAIEDPGALRFEARVPETVAAAGLTPGARAAVRIDGQPGELEGIVAEVDPVSDAATRSRLVKLDLPAAPGLRSGRFGRLLVTAGTAASVSVPAAAVLRRGQLETVFVVDDQNAARLRLVRTGRQRAGRVEIASGLSGGERVVVAGAAELVDGAPVEARR